MMYADFPFCASVNAQPGHDASTTNPTTAKLQRMAYSSREWLRSRLFVLTKEKDSKDSKDRKDPKASVYHERSA
jgi:hypothetical protein